MELGDLVQLTRGDEAVHQSRPDDRFAVLRKGSPVQAVVIQETLVDDFNGWSFGSKRVRVPPVDQLRVGHLLHNERLDHRYGQNAPAFTVVATFDSFVLVAEIHLINRSNAQEWTPFFKPDPTPVPDQVCLQT